MLISINPSSRQSARASGASWLQPCGWCCAAAGVRLISAWLMLFVIFIRELGATILLLRASERGDDQRVALVILSDRSFGSRCGSGGLSFSFCLPPSSC